MATYLPPYLSKLAINFNKFTARSTGYNQQGQPITVRGSQTPSLTANLDLYLGKRNVGSQPWVFTDKEQAPALDGKHKGLPPFTDIVSTDTISSILSVFDQLIDEKIPEYTDSSPEAKARGVAVYPRINRLEANLPYENKAERHVQLIVSMYEDAAYKRQILDADFAVQFVPDEFIERVAQNNRLSTEPEVIEMLRVENNLYKLSDFFSSAAIQQAVGVIATGLFVTLKGTADQYVDMNIEQIMADFLTTFSEVAS